MYAKFCLLCDGKKTHFLLPFLRNLKLYAKKQSYQFPRKSIGNFLYIFPFVSPISSNRMLSLYSKRGFLSLNNLWKITFSEEISCTKELFFNRLSGTLGIFELIVKLILKYACRKSYQPQITQNLIKVKFSISNP